MTYLLLVKHSLPEIIPGLPAERWRLSEEGQRRCDLLAERLAAYAPEMIVSSREPKAQETAQLVARRLSLPVEIASGLHEHERWKVPFTGQEQFEAEIARFFAQPDQLVFGEETARQAQQRFQQAVMAALARYPCQTLVVVAHGTVISLFAAQYCGVEPFPFWKRLGLPACAVLSQPQLTLLQVITEIKKGMPG